MFRHYWSSLLIAVACLIAGFLYAGVQGALFGAFIGVIGVRVSFDNAVVNAKILKNTDRLPHHETHDQSF